MTAPDSDPDTVALTGLTSRGGLSNWIFFFRRADLVMIDVGMMPSLIAGIEAGIRHRVGGPY
jgi:hypothetical protein